jgi:1,4-alpha-glucan branching enzyme
MICKTKSPKPNHLRVMFELPACVWADQIYLVGDFNGWDQTATPFAQGRDGVWRVVLDLPTGRTYQFRYLIDGNWQTDYHADGWTTNNYGTQNSLLSTVLPQEEKVGPEQHSLIHEQVETEPQGKTTYQPYLSPAEMVTVASRIRKQADRAAG